MPVKKKLQSEQHLSLKYICYKGNAMQRENTVVVCKMGHVHCAMLYSVNCGYLLSRERERENTVVVCKTGHVYCAMLYSVNCSDSSSRERELSWYTRRGLEEPLHTLS